MGTRLYVGNLPYDVDEATLREAFGQDGRQIRRVHIPLDRETQRPRGFAFLEFASEEEAQSALATLDGELLGGRPMRVSEAQDDRPERGDRPPRPDRPSRPAGPERHAPPEGGEAHRERHFGPDSRPKRERDKHFKRGKPVRRRHDEDDVDADDHRSRRGHRQFDDDDDY